MTDQIEAMKKEVRGAKAEIESLKIQLRHTIMNSKVISENWRSDFKFGHCPKR
jgi:hypothetical protein